MLISSFKSQDTTDVLGFLSIHEVQIRQKTACYSWFELKDYQNEVVVTILEKGHKFDPSRGSFARFVFGHVEKRLRRATDDALSHGYSMDDDSDRGQLFRAQTESVVAVDSTDGALYANQGIEMVPGAADLVAIANVISGFSAAEWALHMGISKRAVNLKLARAKAQAKHQGSLFDFDEDPI